MKLVTYDPKYRQRFIELNTAWIEGNFGFLEKEDIETFENIEKEIADGAMIFFRGLHDKTNRRGHLGNL